MRIKEVGYIVERLADRFRDLGGQMAGQEAAHKAALTEIRASFNARTSADGKIIEWLRIKVQDARAERDALRAEVAALKSQTPKHPVKVGEWVRRLTGFNTTPAGEVARVTLVDDDDASQLEYEVVRPNGQKGWWSAKGCEPCDPPEADHDTDAGKAAAESALKTEPVAEEIKVGDVVEVFQAAGSMTVAEDIGSGGVVHKVDGLLVWLDRHHTMDLPRQGVASLSDVRKVTT